MGTLESSALTRLRENGTAQYGPALKAWKEEGGKVMGLMYAYVPEEIFTAAGMVPYRLRAFDSTSSALANGRFMELNCSLVRHFYDEMKRGGFSFCDGFVTANACDHERRLYDNALATLGVPFAAMVNFPKKTGPEQVDFYAAGLRHLIDAMESHFGVAVTEEALRGAIDEHNRVRGLQRALYGLQRRECPPLTGADMMAVMLAQTTMPIGDYAALLEELVTDCASAPGIGDYQMRVLVYGGELDSIALIEAIESQGALVVGDYLGYGYRACRKDVPDTGDALHDLAEHIVMMRPDPRQFGTARTRQSLVRALMADCGAEGVIFPAIPLCDYWGWEQHNFALFAKEEGVPVLNLDTEYKFNGEGQIKTRVQAFVETNGRR